MSKNSSLMMACEPGAYFSGEGAGEEAGIRHVFLTIVARATS